MMKKILLVTVLIVSLIPSSIFTTGCDPDSRKPETTRAKPVIYLYPEKEQEVTVKLDFSGILTCTYPEYNGGWSVIARSDGTLINKADNREYSYLFWEGKSDFDLDMSEGFVVEGAKTREFLLDELSEMGLLPKEYNEFIVYWLPQMEKNKYNFIHFENDRMNQEARLDIFPEPDSILRVFMVFKALDKPVKIEDQRIRPFERKGFTVIEWGGCEVGNEEVM